MTQRQPDSEYIWHQGKLVRYADAQVHLLSHTLHYGTGAFEGIRAYKTKDGRTAIFRLPDHLTRFLNSIKVLGCESSLSLEKLMSACVETVRANKFEECYIRPIAWLDDSTRGLKLPPQPSMHISIATWKWGKYMGDEGQQKGVRVGISTIRRTDVASQHHEAKLTGGYVTSVLSRREATLNGMDEAILLDPQGYIAEGSGENVFMVAEGKLFTPPAGAILPGITRASIIEIAKVLGIPVIERLITRNELYIADEVFLTGTAVEVNPVRKIDHLQIGGGKPGPITKTLFESFFKCTRGDHPEFVRWLTYV